MKKEQKINILFYGLLISIGISSIFIGGYFFGLNKRLLETNADANNYEIGYKTALSELVKSGVLPEMQKNYSLTGKIIKISNDNFTLEIDSNPFLKFTSQIRTIKIDNSTRIVKLISKDETKYLKEAQTFNEEMAKIANIKQASKIASYPQMPLWYDEIELTYSDLKENSQIYLQTDYDLTEVENIIPQKITLIQ